jgi:uncharacterized protein (UPF0335 family)
MTLSRVDEHALTRARERRGHGHDCKALAAAERAAAKRRKPAGYTWPLWYEARKPFVEKIETAEEVVARLRKDVSAV